ncbi:hypothetical protein EPR50_G00218050 [Perca flavescens]|uniref:Secreted protein n=1 Tax=Perca flavescens TaxID=8167 RepID=A0A484C9K4_PERFV|nr:hypothetical protein EPR50_G00218050 [Perca flavescens]
MPLLWSWEPSWCSSCLLPRFSCWLCCPASTAAAVESQNTRPPEYSLSKDETENTLRPSFHPSCNHPHTHRYITGNAPFQSH